MELLRDIHISLFGFTIGSEKATKSVKEVAAIIIGYLVFCTGNFKALLLGQKQLIEFACVARNAAEDKEINLKYLYPLRPEEIVRYYWCVVTAVCLGVIFIAWKRQKDAKNAVTVEI